MLICNSSMERTYGMTIVSAKAAWGDNTLPRVTGWAEGWNPPQNATKTTPDGDDTFETQEWTIGEADKARVEPETAKDDDAKHDFVDFASDFVCLWWYFKARNFLN